jgi:hypothetical protein
VEESPSGLDRWQRIHWGPSAVGRSCGARARAACRVASWSRQAAFLKPRFGRLGRELTEAKIAVASRPVRPSSGSHRAPVSLRLVIVRSAVSGPPAPSPGRSDRGTPWVNYVLSGAGAIPAMAAVLAGVLYTVGALTWASQIADAHAPVGDVLPLVPLPQLLAKGIAPTLLVAAAVGLAAMFFGVASVVTRRPISYGRWRVWTPPNAERTKPVPTTAKVFIAVLAVPSVVGMALFIEPWLGYPALALIALLLWGVKRIRVTGREQFYSRLLAGVTVAWIIATAAGVMFFRPPRLPGVRVEMERGGPVRGVLLVSTDQTVVVATPNNERVIIPARAVRRVITRSRRRGRSRSTFELVVGEQPCLTLKNSQLCFDE